MDNERQNREAVCSLGDLVEELFHELTFFPISTKGKIFLVIAMMGDLVRKEGRSVYFQFNPFHQIQRKEPLTFVNQAMKPAPGGEPKAIGNGN